jgi:hypothetical protein
MGSPKETLLDSVRETIRPALLGGQDPIFILAEHCVDLADVEDVCGWQPS